MTLYQFLFGKDRVWAGVNNTIQSHSDSLARGLWCHWCNLSEGAYEFQKEVKNLAAKMAIVEELFDAELQGMGEIIEYLIFDSNVEGKVHVC